MATQQLELSLEPALSRGGDVQLNDFSFLMMSSLNISSLLSTGRKLRSWSERKRAISQ